MAEKRSPKHGSSPKAFPDRDKKRHPEDHASESQADGTAEETTEPEDVEKDLPPNPTMDSAGEIGDPSGRGTLDIDPEVFEKERKKKPDEAA